MRREVGRGDTLWQLGGGPEHDGKGWGVGVILMQQALSDVGANLPRHRWMTGSGTR